MTQQTAAKTKARLLATLAEIAQIDEPDGQRVNVSVYMSTTLGASRAIYQDLTGKPLEPDEEIEP